MHPDDEKIIIIVAVIIICIFFLITVYAPNILGIVVPLPK